MIRWTHAGISPAATAVLWSESVAAEVVVFLFLGPRLLRAVTPAGAMAAAAFCGVVRWGVLAQTVDAIALALVQPLHGFTFALLHLAAMRIMSETVPRDLAATAPAVYGLVAVGGATAILILALGVVVRAFRGGRFLVYGNALRGGIPHYLAAAAGVRWRNVASFGAGFNVRVTDIQEQQGGLKGVAFGRAGLLVAWRSPF